jgi:hypothetical protein
MEDRGNGDVISQCFNLGTGWSRVENVKKKLIYLPGNS